MEEDNRLSKIETPMQQKRFSEAEKILADLAAEDATNAHSGSGLLEKGDYKQALVHFKEALTHDPTNESAQDGLLEALKARNPIYRLFRRFAFWMQDMRAGFHWGVIVAFLIYARSFKVLIKEFPLLWNYFFLILILFAAISFSTWVVIPIANLFLRFNKYGKLLLSKQEKKSSNFVVVSFVLFVAGLLLYIIVGGEQYLALAFFGFAMMMPLGNMYALAKKKKVLLVYTIVLGVVGTLAVAISLANETLINPFSGIFFLGIIGYQWVANYLLIKEDNP
jgi:hypothetical protein